MAYIREYPSGLSVSWNFGQIVRCETRPLCTARLYFIFGIWKHLENTDKEIQSNEFLLAMNSCCLRCNFTIMLMRAILSTLLNSHLSVSGEHFKTRYILLQLYTPDRLYNNENCMRAIPRSMSTLPCLKVLPGKAIIFFSISSHMAFRRRLISVGLGRQGLTDSLIWFMKLA